VLTITRSTFPRSRAQRSRLAVLKRALRLRQFLLSPYTRPTVWSLKSSVLIRLLQPSTRHR